jgi:hypothetical protein
MCSRSASASVREAAADGCFVICFKSVSGRRSTDSGRKYHSALDEILQFANIAGPVVRFEHFHHFIRNQVDGP